MCEGEGLSGLCGDRAEIRSSAHGPVGVSGLYLIKNWSSSSVRTREELFFSLKQ